MDINISVGPEVFVGLKKGSISVQYKIGEILGEGTEIYNFYNIYTNEDLLTHLSKVHLEKLIWLCIEQLVFMDDNIYFIDIKESQEQWNLSKKTQF